ncbi:MAG: hypothetical protein M1838_005165 [Thelocarpon superellum]|nr:MAG: hypothetical protein M1838_005165 [Thelocarpon superellum]
MSAWGIREPVGVVDKVLRRAEVAKMARLLQTRLALARFKTKHGWENLDLDTIEPKVDMELKRKRPSSSGETVSDSSSSVSDTIYPSALLSSSSPSGAAIFSDEIARSGDSGVSRKRAKQQRTFEHPGSTPNSHLRARSMTNGTSQGRASRAVWKDVHRLPQSSPVYERQPFPFSIPQPPTLSFASDTATIPHDPSMKLASTPDEDEQDLPLPQYPSGSASSHVHSSPPRTPPPTRARSARLHHSELDSSASRNPATGEEGADLLLYLATSPSPANPALKARIFPPSTPPSRNLALPSSMMTTPSGGAYLGGYGAPNTPSQGFNFADFVNITPSPAQGGWNNRTPATAKTPLAAREARRRLNFDALVPPTGSPHLNALTGGSTKQTGLGMELGGELVS